MTAESHTDWTHQAEHAALVALSLRACEVAKSAVAHVAQGLARRSAGPFRAVKKCEEELDRLEREIDQGVTSAISRAPDTQARELLACLKSSIHVERIGDLMDSLADHAQALGSHVAPEDIHDLVRMASALETMLVDVYDAFSKRDLGRSVAILQADAQIDVLRNLMFDRHLGEAESGARRDSFHLLFMAQSLERAGDHAKNLAEEVFHLVSGHTIRHAVPESDESREQMYVRFLLEQQGAARRNPCFER